MRETVLTFLHATVIPLIFGISAQAQPTRVTAIPNASTNFFTVGDLVYFTSGNTLLRTDGTEGGTITLRTGFTSSLSGFREFNDMLVFISGNELWRSDGTPAGTILLTTKAGIELLSATSTILFFRASDAATGVELYRTNGTSGGTTLVKDINPGPANGFIGNSAIVGNELFFRGNNGVNGDEPWKSNGTAVGTVMIEDINPGSANGFVHGSPYNHGDVISYNGLLYFTARTSANGKEPWVSDGTAAGTLMLKDVETGAAESRWILWAIGHDGAVYFILQPAFTWDFENSALLWKTSGTTASTVSLATLHKDFEGGDITYRNPFRIYKNKIYFFAHQTVGDGPHYLWVSDGTTLGTFEVADMNDWRSISPYKFFEVVGDYMFFNTSVDGNPSGLYRSDGTAAGTGVWYYPNSAAQFRPPTKFTEVSDMLFYADHDAPPDEGGLVDDPDDYFHLFQNDGETWQSMRTMYGVSTVGTNNIVDYNGVVAFTTQNDQEGSTDTQKYLWIYDPSNTSNALIGKIDQEIWNGVPGTKVSDIPVNQPPSSVRELTLFETPSNTGDNYGSRVRGFLVPPISGYYTFWIASDDQGELWLSTDMDPANKVKIAEVSGWTNSRQWNKYPSQTSQRILLQRDQRYYIEALFKEGTGGDHLSVGWSAPRTGLERPIPGNRLMPYSDNALPIVTITNPEEGEVFPDYANITITADATDADGSITEVEFYHDGFFLGEDETAPYSFTWEHVFPRDYTLTVLGTDNDGGIRTDTVRISVRRGIACEGAGLIRQEFWTGVPDTGVSDIPTDSEPDFTQDLTLFEGPASSVGDNYGSRIRGYICPPTSGQYIFWISGDDQVELWLGTGANPFTKTRIAYHTGWTNKRQWTKYPTQQSAEITLQANQRYYIEALMKEGSGGDHVSVGWQLPDGSLQRPIAGTHLIPFMDAPDEVCAGTGTISLETWTGIDGPRVSSIPVNTPPNFTGEQTIFEAPTNVGSNFGSRARGYVCVPATGNYTFWIASDDHGELWLSTDADPANKRRIAHVSGWTSPRQWTKYATQQSAPVSLVAGQQYYIEALYKEDEGGDNMAVGWQLPDGTLERPIPGSRLSPFGNGSSATAARMTSEEELYSQISVYPNPARSGDPKLTISGYDNIDRTIETNVRIMNMTGDVVFSETISCGGNCGSYIMDINKQLVPGVYVVNMETDGVRSARRLLVK
jgi:ELWxxDGT repeat protein